MEQDAKGLYAAAREGMEENVVGVDIDWHVPTAADLVFDADLRQPPEDMARQVVAGIPRLTKALDG